MALRHASDIESFITAVETLETGDTVEVDIRLPAVQQNCWMGFAVLQTAVRIS